jgi:hypothetical protein
VNSSHSESLSKKVLIITYYWPPSGGSPVLRWLKFARYLRDFGWEPTIYTPANPVPQAMDDSLLNEIPSGITVLKTQIWEPYKLFNRLSGKGGSKSMSTAFISESGKKGFTERFSVWIRGNIFIPDARKFWIRPSVKYLYAYLRQNPHDVIISTGPPHSMHLIAKVLRRKTGIRWVADFRDPWTNIDFYSELKLTRYADARHHRLERQVLDEADRIITVGPTMTREFEQLTVTPVTTITNGFDATLMDSVHGGRDESFTILHVGSMPASRNPEKLWYVLGKLLEEKPELRASVKIELIGPVDFTILTSITVHKLESCLVKRGHTSNREVLKRMKEATVLLLVINNTQNAAGILTNKFFEYLSAKRTILAIGPPNGDAAKILEECTAGKIFDYHDETGLESYLSELIDQFRKGSVNTDTKNIDTFSRRYLTGKLVKILDSLLS